MNKAFRAMRDLQSGITYINAGTTGAEVHLPFGGTKDTGNGHREAGQAALDVFTEWKSLYVDYSGKLQRAQIDNVEHGSVGGEGRPRRRARRASTSPGRRGSSARYNGNKVFLREGEGRVHMALAPGDRRPLPRARRAA